MPNLSASFARNNSATFGMKRQRVELVMSGNFGIRPLKRKDRARIWPMWAVALIAVSVINAAVLLHHR